MYLASSSPAALRFFASIKDGRGLKSTDAWSLAVKLQFVDPFDANLVLSHRCPDCAQVRLCRRAERKIQFESNGDFGALKFRVIGLKLTVQRVRQVAIQLLVQLVNVRILPPIVSFDDIELAA